MKSNLLAIGGAAIMLSAMSTMVTINAATIIDDQIETIRGENDAVGIVAWSVDGNGNMCSIGTAGERIKGSGEEIPAEGHSRHHIGSVSKTMTATLIAILIEDGTIPSWESTLGEVIPHEASGSAYENVTLRQLLGCLSGLAYTVPDNFFSYQTKAPTDLREQRRLASIDALESTPESPPGTAYIYSNWSYLLAGHIIEELTNMLWEEALVTLLFEPLGIELNVNEINSFTGAPNNDIDAWGHSGTKKLDPCNPSTSEVQCDNPPVIGPAGTFSGPVAAMSQYFAFHVSCHKGNHPLLSEESCKTLHQPADPSFGLFGFGWVCMPREWAAGGDNDDDDDDQLACTSNGSNTLNLYTVWLGFGIDRAYVAYTNQFREEGSEFDTTDSVIATMIMNDRKNENNNTHFCEAPIPYDVNSVQAGPPVKDPPVLTSSSSTIPLSLSTKTWIYRLCTIAPLLLGVIGI